jgi:deoxyribodipyrimidine photo-lyase
MTDHNIIIWYRNDLRSHDHEPLAQAAVEAERSGAKIIPVYCFDDRNFGETAFGFAKTGPFRAKFLIESVADLRRSLRGLGSDLVILRGKPEVEIANFAEQFDRATVYFHQEALSEETRVDRSLTQSLRSLGKTVKSFWGHTLYHPQDLPFEVNDIPEVFTTFRKAVEKDSTVRSIVSPPQTLPALPEGINPGELPSLESLGVMVPEPDSRQQIQFIGGETAGLDRVKQYIWKRDKLKLYKETRNGMLDPDDSTKFSPWLALGCVSPRYLYEQVDRYEQKRVRNESTYWLIFELLWRDYFRFMGLKHGDRLFRVEGLQGVKLDWTKDWARFEYWRDGETGFPLIDANMQELAATGYMSNRGRQNVGSFLTKNLGIDWRIGAEYFESVLIDYDGCSNWGNWNYTAGVGNDARGFRYFNIPKQSRDYDPQGAYVKHWLPALDNVPSDRVHEPWKLTGDEQRRWSVKLGTDYPRPIVDLMESAAANEKRYNAALGLGSRDRHPDDRRSKNRRKK